MTRPDYFDQPGATGGLYVYWAHSYPVELQAKGSRRAVEVVTTKVEFYTVDCGSNGSGGLGRCPDEYYCLSCSKMLDFRLADDEWG